MMNFKAYDGNRWWITIQNGTGKIPKWKMELLTHNRQTDTEYL